MDAVKFVEERRRMFAVSGKNPKYSLFNMTTRAEDVVKEVEEWSAEHPYKTRQSEFLKQYPNAKLIDGVGAICPKTIDISLSCPIRDGIDCPYCRRKFWMQEVE